MARHASGQVPTARRWRRIGAAGLSFVAAVCLVTGAAAQGGREVPEAVARVLTSVFGFTRSDLAETARGGTVVRGLDVTDHREVSAVGVIAVDVPAAFYAAQIRDIVRFKRHEAVRQIGVFGHPAQAADLAGLTLEHDDLTALRACMPGACSVNLSAEAIADARRTIPWGTPRAAEAANAWYRATLARMVRDYQATGEHALMRYAGGEHLLSPVDEFRALVTSPPSLLAAFPEVQAHLLQYPRRRSASVYDLIYWSKEKVGPKLVTSITHMAIAEALPSSAPVSHVAASRQIYGSQLYEASLGLTVMVRDPTDANRMYLVYANRSRVDAIGGLFGPIKRTFVRSRARATLGPTLERAKRDVERRYAPTGSQD